MPKQILILPATQQFLHGEQGALICTAKITQTVPWHDAKLYSATQVMDDARHVEVFAKYLNEKLGGEYSVNIHLRMSHKFEIGKEIKTV